MLAHISGRNGWTLHRTGDSVLPGPLIGSLMKALYSKCRRYRRLAPFDETRFNVSRSSLTATNRETATATPAFVDDHRCEPICPANKHLRVNATKSLQIPVRVAPSVFVDGIGQRNTTNRPESAHRVADREQSIGMDARRQPERGFGFLVEVQIPASSESPQIEGSLRTPAGRGSVG
jgi:hypothetical protein